MFLLQPEVGWEDKQNWCYQVDVVCFIMPSENENNNNNSDNINSIVPLVVMSYLLSTILAVQEVIGFSRIRNAETF